jgi:hypothetical protein
MGEETTDDVPGADLAEAVRVLRDQLSRAVAEGQGEDLRFLMGPVSVEFEVALTREVGVEGGVRFWVVTASGTGTLTRASTHRVSFELRPVVRDPGSGALTSVEMGDVVQDDTL